jgi:predicted ATP-dependent protease
VLPVGGIKGKILAARRAGIKRVILPARNRSDLRDIPEDALRNLEIIFVERIDELLPQVLTPVEAAETERPQREQEVETAEHEPIAAGSEVVAQGGEAPANPV